MYKKQIKEIIVVEGKTDTSKLKSIFDVQTIETNGRSFGHRKINDIKRLSKTKGIIFFLDPDGPGESIRKRLIEYFPNAKHCFLKKEIFDINAKKIGIAEADNASIIEALENIVTFSNDKNSLKWDEYINLDLNSLNKRKKICDFLKISYCNNKQLFKRFNMMNISYTDIKKIIEENNI